MPYITLVLRDDYDANAALELLRSCVGEVVVLDDAELENRLAHAMGRRKELQREGRSLEGIDHQIVCLQEAIKEQGPRKRISVRIDGYEIPGTLYSNRAFFAISQPGFQAPFEVLEGILRSLPDVVSLEAG